jgi:hypothetical protein
VQLSIPIPPADKKPFPPLPSAVDSSDHLQKALIPILQSLGSLDEIPAGEWPSDGKLLPLLARLLDSVSRWLPGPTIS